MTEPPGAERPVLRVVSGEATPEEIAAVIAAVAATSPTSTSTTFTGTATTSIWSAPGYAHRDIRATFTPGPNGWRTSFWPR